MGKTQLLEAIRARNDRGDDRIIREITSLNGPVNLIFSENTTQRGLSLNGLIDYVKNSDQRLVSISRIDQQINNSITLIDDWPRQYVHNTDKIARLQLDNIKGQEEHIRNLQDQKLTVNIYAYKWESRIRYY